MKSALGGALALLLVLFVGSQGNTEESAVKIYRNPCYLKPWEEITVNANPLNEKIYQILERAHPRCIYGKFKTATLGVILIEPTPPIEISSAELEQEKPDGYVFQDIPFIFQKGILAGVRAHLVISEPLDPTDSNPVYSYVTHVPLVYGSEHLSLSIGLRGTRHTYSSPKEIEEFILQTLPVLLRPASK